MRLEYKLGADTGVGVGVMIGVGIGLGVEVRVGGVGSDPLSDITLAESPGAGAGAEGSLLPGVLVAPALPLTELGLGPPAKPLPLLELGLSPFAETLPLLPPPVLGATAPAEPLPLLAPGVGPDIELVGVSVAGAWARLLPDAPGLVGASVAGAWARLLPDAVGLDDEEDGAGARAVWLPVAGVRGTTADLPGVVPGGIDGTGTSLCRHQPQMPLYLIIATLHTNNWSQERFSLSLLLESQSASHQMHLQNAKTETCCQSITKVV